MKTLIVIAVLVIVVLLIVRALKKRKAAKAHRESAVSFAQDQIRHTQAAQVQRRQSHPTVMGKAPANTVKPKPRKRYDEDEEAVSGVYVDSGYTNYEDHIYVEPAKPTYTYEPPASSSYDAPSTSHSSGSSSYSSDSGSSGSSSSSSSSSDSSSSGGGSSD